MPGAGGGPGVVGVGERLVGIWWVGWWETSGRLGWEGWAGAGDGAEATRRADRAMEMRAPAGSIVGREAVGWFWLVCAEQS